MHPSAEFPTEALSASRRSLLVQKWFTKVSNMPDKKRPATKDKSDERRRCSASVIQREDGPPQGLQNAVLREYEDDNKVFGVIGYPDIRPNHIRFSQDSVYHKFKDSDFQTAFNQLAVGDLTPHGLFLMRVVARADCVWMTHDDRRLLLYQALEREGLLRTVPS